MMEEGLDVDRVRELEAMVQKLTKENKRLLTKADQPTNDNGNDRTIGNDSDSDDVLCHHFDSDSVEEDEWLFTSPVKPPTKEQKQITPSQWLEQGLTRIRGNDKMSLREAQKVLTFTLEEEEQFNISRTPERLKSINGSAKKYLNRTKTPHNNSEGGVSGEPSRRNTYDIVKPDSNDQTIRKIKWTPTKHTDEEEDVIVSSGTPSEDALEPPPTTNSVTTDQPVSLKVAWDPSKVYLTDSEEETVEPERKWKVKQVSDVPVDEETTLPQRKWKVKQVSDVPQNDEESQETVEPERKWKVKQVSDVPVDEETTLPQRKWKVKQVSDVPQDDEESQETVEPERKWKVKQVSDVPVDEETTLPQRKWKVKQVSDVPQDDEETTLPQREWKVKQVSNMPQSETMEAGSPLQRSGTFTKVDRKLMKPRQNALKMKWTPKNVSPSSSEEDVSRRSPSIGSDQNEEPAFTSYPTLPRPEKSPPDNQNMPSQRGVSPVRHMIPQQRGVSPIQRGMSPLQYNTKSPIRTSRSPSPSPVTSSLRPPSPRRTSNNTSIGEPTTRRQLPTPGKLRSPRQQMTPPTKSPGQGFGYQPGNSPHTPQTTPTQRGQGNPHTPQTTPTQRGQGSPSLSSKRGRGLISPSGQRGRGLTSPSQRQAIPRRGGVNQRGKMPSKPPSTSDEGWLDGCY